MKYFLQTSAFTFLMYFALWSIWISFAVDIGVDSKYPGSLVFLPHAARVLCTCMFGWYAIPAMVCADWVGLTFFASGDPILVNAGYSFQEFSMSLFACSSVYMALLLLKISGFSFHYSHGSLLLQKSNYQHIFLITVISATINGLFGSLLRQLATDYDVHMFTVLRFTIGDILGCLVVLATCTIMMSAYKDLLLRNKNNSIVK